MNLNIVVSKIDIKHQNLNILFSDFKTIRITDINELKQFYICNKEQADKLTLDDEFVGLTYSNLAFLENFINLEKPKQKVLKNQL